MQGIFINSASGNGHEKSLSKSRTNEKMIKTKEKSFVKFPEFSFFTQGKVEKIPLHFSVKKKNTFWRINFLIEKKRGILSGENQLFGGPSKCAARGHMHCDTSFQCLCGNSGETDRDVCDGVSLLKW